jgi:chromosome segregation ATPase
MCKKVLIAALAVVVGLAVLGMTGTKVGGLIRLKWNQVREHAKEQVSPETEIQLIEQRLDQLKNDDRRFVDQIVRYDMKADDMRKQVAATRTRFDKLDGEVRDMFVSLKTEGEKVSYRDLTFTRREMQKQVHQDGEKLQVLEGQLKAEEGQLKELTETRNLYEKRLSELRTERESLKTEVQRIRNTLLQERLAQEKGKIENDDGGLGSVRQDLRAVKQRIEVMKKTREHTASSDDGPVRKALADKERQANVDSFLQKRYGGGDSR